MIFLPRTDLGAQEACRTIVESAIIEEGYTIYGWRQVPSTSRSSAEGTGNPARDRADHDRRPAPR